MATTTNFGWETPDNTDLVKDGALAIRTLGSAIDTSLVDLKGGTTGQNLRKATNTDLDFTWAGDATNTVIDAEGDLLVGDSADTLQRLAIGTTGQVLTVDTAIDGKVKWASASGGLTLIDAHSFSAVSAVSRDNVFSGTYQNYLVVVEGVGASDVELRMRLRVGGTDATGANYNYALIFRSNTTLSSGFDSTGTTWEIGYFGTITNVASITLNDPFAASKTAFHSQSGGINNPRPLFIGGGGHDLATSYDGFTLSASGVNLTGTVRTYGLAN